MSARYDPKATFAYVREVQSLPPPTTIESAIRDDSNHTFSQPFFYSGHQLGGAGDTSTTAPAIGVSSVLYMGPGAMTPPPRASASLPPLQAFEEPSVLRNTFERDFPRPLRRVLSATKHSTSSKSIIATAASSSGFGVKDELRCDRITALAMGSFLEGLGCPVHDCVTPNDFAVRLSEALRLQYNLDAELSTAKQSGKVKLLASRSVTLQRLEQKNATAAEGAQHAQQQTEAQWPKEAKQLVDELRRSLRGQAFDIEQLRDRLAGRIKQVDLKRSQRCVGALRDSLKDMAKEVGFIRDDIKDAFVQFTREFEELPVVKEIKERQPKLRQFDRPPAATEDGAPTAPPAPAAISAGALLRLSVRVTHAAAQYAGDVCNVDMPSDTTANQEFAPVLTRTLVGAAGLVHDDFQALLSHDGSEKAIVAKALRSASWALQMLKELTAARERVSHLESQLSHAEQRNRELAAKASSSPPRDARSPPVSPTAPPAANRGGKNNTKAAAPAKAPSAKALPPSAGAGKKVIAAKPPPGAKTAAAVDDDGISNATNVTIPQPETNAPTTAAASSTPPPPPGVDAAPHQTDEHRQQQQQHDGEPPTAVSLPPPLSASAPTTATTTVKHHGGGGGQRSVSQHAHHHRLRAQRVIQQALNDAAEAAVHPNGTAGDVAFTVPALTEQSTIAELLDWLEATTAEGTNQGGGDDVVVAKAASVASGQASPNWSDDDGDGSLSDADGVTATAVQHRLDRAVPSGASAGPSNSRRPAATNTRGGGAAGTSAGTAIPSSGASSKPARRESVSNTATHNNNSTAGGGHRGGAPAAVESDPTTAVKQGGSATPAATATAAGGRRASSGQPNSATRAAETQQQPPREDGSSVTAAAVGPGKPNVKGPARKTSATGALQPSQEQAKSTTPSTTTTAAAVSDAKTSPSGEVAPTAATKPPPPPAAVVKPSRKALAAALREATPSTASPPPSASPIPRDASGGGESPTNALDSPGGAAPPLPTLPAISTTPSISAAQVLKFRFTAASPKPNNAAAQRTVAHASDADRLERMRRSLEGGLQLHRFKAAHQLLFDERLDVPTPEPTAEELSMHRLGDTAPRH